MAVYRPTAPPFWTQGDEVRETTWHKTQSPDRVYGGDKKAWCGALAEGRRIYQNLSFELRALLRNNARDSHGKVDKHKLYQSALRWADEGYYNPKVEESDARKAQRGATVFRPWETDIYGDGEEFE